MLWIKAEGTPGDNVKDVIAEAVKKAQSLGIGIEINFNGTKILIHPNTTETEAYHQFTMSRSMK